MRPTNVVLDGIDFSVDEGSVCALVGKSGGGKSTLVHLLLRFYDPQAGRISLGGVDYRDLNLASLHKQIGVVSQETQLFNATIQENIAYGAPPHTDAELAEATRAACASEFIASYNYAAKKTKKTITVALAALEGGACMNNTFCLAIFMALVFFRGLAWRCAPCDACRTRRPRRRTAHASSTPPPPRPAPHRAPRSSRCRYTAETVGTLIIECVVAVFAMKKTQTLLDGALIFSLFPLSIAFIAGLEAFGFD